jgi:IS1 family transposase
LSKPEVFPSSQSRFGNDHSFRFLLYSLGKTSAVPLQRLRSDFLQESGHRLLPAPASSCYLRRSRCSQRRGREQILDCQSQQIACNTVARWLEKAAAPCWRFNDRNINGFAVTELQADEIRTIVGGKQQPIWIFAAIEVWSRLWPSTIVGRRSCRNTFALFREISDRMNFAFVPLIATDGFEFYRKVIRRIFGAAWRLEETLRHSEDLSKLNTSFIERLNLTVRQGSSYLGRRTICYARWTARLEDHLELLRCYYNFIRKHRALKFGRGVRTPAMQAGLVSKRLSFREVFAAEPKRILFVVVFIDVTSVAGRVREQRRAA